jgi:hypothetical protein
METEQTAKTDQQNAYIASLNEKELQAYHIAKSHLGNSFSLEKSLGFIKWKQTRV